MTDLTLPEKDRHFVWHPFTPMKEYANEEPLVIVSGEGNYLLDAAGRRYLDGVSSLWVNLHGHRKREIDEAISRQLEKIAHSTLLGTANEPSIRLAERLVRLAERLAVPPTPGLSKVFYSDNGSTAVEVALKIAFEYWQLKGRREKQKFLSFRDAYHGDTLGAVSVGHIELFHEIYRPLLFRTFQAPSPTDPACLGSVEDCFKRNAGEIAACVIEPLVQAAGGMIVQPPGFLKKLRELCSRYEVLLIADEVATGFGRTGTMFACEQEGVSPDLLCLAKGITGGYLPLAATLSTEEIYGAFWGDALEFKTFFHGHSYTGNPLGCAAALANLEIFEKEKILEQLPRKMAILTESLLPLKRLPAVRGIRQKGLMVGIELGSAALEARLGHAVCLEARKKGLLIRPLGNVIVLMPPLSITEDEIRYMVAAVAGAITTAIREVTGRG